MSNEPEQLEQLARRLLSLTVAKRISWSEADRPGMYLYSTSSSSVSVTNQDLDDKQPYILTLHGESGSPVDSLSSHFHHPGEGEEEPALNTLLQDLYVAARRSAMNIEGILDALYSELPPD